MKSRISIPLLIIAVGAVACASGGAVQRAESSPQPSAALSPAEHSLDLPPVAPPGAESGSTDAAELAAYARAKPVLQAHCASCHTTHVGSSNSKALQHFSMDEYPLGEHHAREIGSAIREVLGASGSKPTMPEDDPGAVQGQELQLILAWAESFDRAHPGNATPHQHDDDDDGDADGDDHEH